MAGEQFLQILILTREEDANAYPTSVHTWRRNTQSGPRVSFVDVRGVKMTGQPQEDTFGAMLDAAGSRMVLEGGVYAMLSSARLRAGRWDAHVTLSTVTTPEIDSRAGDRSA